MPKVIRANATTAVADSSVTTSNRPIDPANQLFVFGTASAYPRALDFSLFRQVADEVGATLIVDMAHFAGLVATGVHSSPIPFAHYVTSTTHKTLRGPRGGLILCSTELAKPLNSKIFPGI